MSSPLASPDDVQLVHFSLPLTLQLTNPLRYPDCPEDPGTPGCETVSNIRAEPALPSLLRHPRRGPPEGLLRRREEGEKQRGGRDFGHQLGSEDGQDETGMINI